MRDIAEIRKLPLPERLQLVGEIWDSILEDPQLLPVSESLVHELERRLAEHRAHPATSESWEAAERSAFGDE